MNDIRIGIIGTGGIAQLHASQFQALPNVEVVAVVYHQLKNGQAFLEQTNLPAAQLYADYQTMYQEAALDAVVICSPHAHHYQQAIDALASGLHILIEKPMTCTTTEAEKLLRAAEQSGLVLQVAYQRHFLPSFQYLHDAVQSGQIGKLTSISAALYQDWVYLTKGSWRQVPELSGGGFLLDSGSHIIDMLLWISGLSPQALTSAISSHGYTVELDTTASIQFDNGAVASLTLIGHAPFWHETYLFCGDKGAVKFDNEVITLHLLGEEPQKIELPEQRINQAEGFIQAVRGEAAPVVTADFAMKVIQLSEQIYRAAGYAPLSH